jgi:hypothetical protein
MEECRGKSSIQQEGCSFHQKIGPNLRKNLCCATEGAFMAFMALKIGHFEKLIKSTWEVSKCGAGK